MKSNYENVFYTPKFSSRSNIAVRRLSWFIDKPMTVTMDAIIEYLPNMVDAKKVCQSCKIKDKCKYCVFNIPKSPQVEQNENVTHENVTPL